MTTIAYSHKDKQIAVDSRTSKGSLIATDTANKIIEKYGKKFILSGVVSDHNALIEKIVNNTDSNYIIESSGYMIDNGNIFEIAVEENKSYITEINHDSTLGSGEDFALAALDMGKSAKEAVEYAATRDVYTGGKVQVIDIVKEDK